LPAKQVLIKTAVKRITLLGSFFWLVLKSVVYFPCFSHVNSVKLVNQVKIVGMGMQKVTVINRCIYFFQKLRLAKF